MRCKLLISAILFSIIFVIILSTASATVGIGIKWFTEAEYVKEGSTHCINYGLYNPFDTDVYGYLTASKELEPLYSTEDAKLIPANTPSANVFMTEICFKIPKNIYPKSCILGTMCERRCQGVEEKSFKGEVVAAYQIQQISGSGSSTGSSFAAPLVLKMRCEEKKRNYLVLVAVIVIIIAIIAGLWYILKKKRQPY